VVKALSAGSRAQHWDWALGYVEQLMVLEAVPADGAGGCAR
jgi:hypothetical protein